MACRSIAADIARRKSSWPNHVLPPGQRRARGAVAQVEDQEVVFEARADVDGVVLAAGQRFELLGGGTAHHVEFTGLESQQLGIGAGNRQQHQPIEVGKGLAVPIALPVVGVALEHDALAGHDFAHPERSGADDRRRRRGDRPLLRQRAGGVRCPEHVPGQDGDAVEHPIGDRVRLGERDDDGEVVDLAHADRLAGDNQQVALRRGEFLVQVDLEREHDIVGGQRVAVGEFQAGPQLEGVFTPVRRGGPRRGQRRLGLERAAIDVYQVRVDPLEDGLGRVVGNDDRIERARRASLGDDQLSAVPVVGGGTGGGRRGCPLLRQPGETEEHA
jgi:hypothetical protein